MALLIKVTLDLLEFKKFLIVDGLIVGMLVNYDLIFVSLIHFHAFLDNVNFFDSKLYSTQFYDISSLHDIFDLVITMLKTSDNKVHVLIKLFGHCGHILLAHQKLLFFRSRTRGSISGP
jgi:hypothetical protein